jgi:hypothetical protein
MNRQNRHDITERIHLYIDGQLDERQAREFEAWLAGRPEARREYDTLLATKRLVGSRPPTPENEWFWDQLSGKLDAPPQRTRFILIPHRYLPLAYATVAVFVVCLGVTAYIQRDDLARFFTRKSSEVQQAYETGLKGWFMPLFAKTDKDGVLEFAMYGTIPLDRESDRVLRVDNTNKDGYKLELSKVSANPKKPVTTEDLYRTVRATPDQRRSIDSLLADAQLRIEESVLMSENKRIAISATMSDLNTTILNGVATLLDGPQRVRFDRFLSERETPYTVVMKRVPVPVTVREPRTSMAYTTGEDASQFVVITPEEAKLERLEFNLDSIRQNMEAFGRRDIPRIAYQFENMAKKYVEKSRTERNTAPQVQRLVEVVEDPHTIGFQINESSGVDGRSLAIQVRPRSLQRSIPSGEQIPQLRFRFFKSDEGAVELNIDSIVGMALQQIPDLNVRVLTQPAQTMRPKHNVQMPVLPPPAPPVPNTGVHTMDSDYEDLVELYEEYAQSRKEYTRAAEAYTRKMKEATGDPELIQDLSEEYREQTLDMLSLQKAYQKALQEYQKQNAAARKKR